MGSRFFDFINKHPIWVIVTSLLFAFLVASGAQNLVFKGDYRVFFGDENPELIAFESMQNVYSKTDNVAFVVAPKDGNVFSPEHLESLKVLTKASWQIPYSTRVDSVTNFQHTYAEEDDMTVEKLVLSTGNLSDADLAKIKQVAVNEPLLVNKTVSPSGHVSVVNVTVQLPGIDVGLEVPEVAKSAREIKEIYLAQNPDAEVYLSGMVMMNTSFTESALEDSATLVPLMFLIVVVVIGVLLRTIAGTFATVVIIIMSIATTMGVAGWTGFYLTGPSSSAPTMILTLAVADCIHVLTSMFYEMRQGASKEDAIKRSLKVNLQPIFLTSVTTAIGFLSMNFSDSPPFRDLGNLVALGVMLAFVFSVTVFPAMLRVLPIRVKVDDGSKVSNMSKLSDFVVSKRRVLLPTMALAILSTSIFLPQNELDDDFVKYFDETVDFRNAADFMQDNISGMALIEVSVETGESSGINNPKYLQTVADFTDWLRQQPEVDHVNTITDTLMRLNKNMHGDDAAWYKLPDDQALSAQYLLLYEMSLPYGLDLNNQLNVDKSASKISVTLKNITSNEMLYLEDSINKWFANNGRGYNAVVASPSVMFAHIGQRSIYSMLIGTTLALLLISLLLGIALKSWRYGLISLIPNLVPAAVGFGIWGLFYGYVGLGLSVVVGMTLGIVVDDTVHFLSKYLRARREKDLDAIDAVHYAFDNVGRALIVTTFVLAAGFAVLAQSSFALNADMGLLTAMTIVIALVVDFFFLPPLLIWLDKKSGSGQHAKNDSVGDAQVTLTQVK
ncbi:efflux RND transporter permease subunit [Agaribacter marinus]|uniref:RND transporter n=1 Tax=Agaribacter marinus TaxID=1431249 RepID=A0AA37WJX5_9ALTE|nr:MMPL family transporter [Agaribacter marinus]GLR70310.1 RND transporter [Agaribacter marinus]